ncbi:hypothetical protein CKAH01_04824 [Colletotrichum kahawae]|uniref:Uncharacterized protein n=1 Tax=Colletotrichum kahawae TaxID=34407 RepID=A0AAE0D7R5_COLKA|nr:hypothetical protein CKAH01_04824 [Colletotrichum kahawae]
MPQSLPARPPSPSPSPSPWPSLLEPHPPKRMDAHSPTPKTRTGLGPLLGTDPDVPCPIESIPPVPPANHPPQASVMADRPTDRPPDRPPPPCPFRLEFPSRVPRFGSRHAEAQAVFFFLSVPERGQHIVLPLHPRPDKQNLDTSPGLQSRKELASLDFFAGQRVEWTAAVSFPGARTPVLKAKKRRKARL